MNMIFLRHSHRRLFIIMALAFSVGIDQWTKFLARRFLDTSGEISLTGNLVQLSLAKNHHGFLGLVGDLPDTMQFLFLYVGVALLLLACLAWLFFSPTPRYKLPLLLVSGGGLSNLLDRLLHHGGVTDFISVGLGSFRSGIFNLADIFILGGGSALGYLLFSPPPPSVRNPGEKKSPSS